MNKKLKAAIGYLEQGFSVIPVHYVLPDGSCSCSAGAACHSPGKHPAAPSWKTFQNKRPDRGTLELWFDGRFRESNVGIITGTVSGNIFVVDVDVGEGKDGEDTLHDLQMQNDDLPDTMTAITGSGGRHFFYRAPAGVKVKTGTNTLGNGVDTRGEGGFVVAAPSKHVSGREYTINESPVVDAPDWLLALVVEKSEPVLQVSNAPQVGNVSNVIETGLFGKELRTDGRKQYMVECVIGGIASHWKKEGSIPSMQWMVDEVYPAYARNVKARGESLDHDGRGIRLFQETVQYQLKRAMQGELRAVKENERGSEVKQSAAAAQITEKISPTATRNPTDFNIADWNIRRFAGKAPEQEWLVSGVLPLRVPGLIAAQGGVGKSGMMLEFVCKVAGGDKNMHTERMFGHEIEEYGKAVFIGAEDSAASLHRRIDGLPDQTIRARAEDRLFIVPLPDAGGPMGFVLDTREGYVATDEYANLHQQLTSLGDLKLIVFDPLQAFVHADVNSDPAAAQFFWSMMSNLAVETGATVLVAHHMRKEGSFSIRKGAQAREAIRGTTALVDGARWVYALWQMPESEESIIAQRMGFESGVGHAICGGVVKVNDVADRETKAFIRGESGFLEERTSEVNAIVERSATLDTAQTAAIFKEVSNRWLSHDPFAVGTNTPRSFLAWLKTEYGMPHGAARSYLEAWISQGYLENAIIDPSKKTRGLKVIREPDPRPVWGRDE